jgi:hypothetical protein
VFNSTPGTSKQLVNVVSPKRSKNFLKFAIVTLTNVNYIRALDNTRRCFHGDCQHYLVAILGDCSFALTCWNALGLISQLKVLGQNVSPIVLAKMLSCHHWVNGFLSEGYQSSRGIRRRKV